MILHLAEDEKFIDHVIDVFEAVSPNQSVYYIQPAPGKKELVLVKSKHPNIIVADTDSDEFKTLIKKLSSFDAIIAHNLIHPYKLDLIEKAPTQTPIHWMSWGADLYGFIPLKNRLYLPHTKRLINIKTRELLLNCIQKNFFHIYKRYYQLKHKSLPPICKLKRINSISTVLPNEMTFVEKYISKNIKYHPFKYGSIESLVPNRNLICIENNFLIGNSAYPSSNHLDALEIMKSIDINENKIVVPLSYGNKSYRDNIIKAGKCIFPNRFTPIIDYLDINEYNEILSKCGNVIMNHLRQQAMGNIIISLWMGARVYLNTKNPSYIYLKSIGAKVYSINDIKNYKSLPSFQELANYNQPILSKIYNREQVLKETANLVRSLTKY